MIINMISKYRFFGILEKNSTSSCIFYDQQEILSKFFINGLIENTFSIITVRSREPPLSGYMSPQLS